jgi:phosphatidylinositol alpha-mannosyltransferase
VLASDLDAFDRVLDHGRAGVMFANGDSADLAARAGDLLADPSRRAELAVAGRERAAVYDWERVAREIVDVYDSVTVTGVPVQCDLRGQLVGRLARFTRSGEDRPGEPS